MLLYDWMKGMYKKKKILFKKLSTIDVNKIQRSSLISQKKKSNDPKKRVITHSLKEGLNYISHFISEHILFSAIMQNIL